MTKFFFKPILLVLTPGILIYLSCRHDPLNPVVEPISARTLSLDSFSTLPPEIDGCACYFSDSEEEFKHQRYIYADDYGKNAFVSINGVMTKFELIASDTLPGNRSIETFLNENYEIVIELKKIERVDKVWQKTGTLKLKSRNGKAVTKKIYGECSC